MFDNYVDIIFLAIIAGFIFLRLRGVLGQRGGHEQSRGDMFKVGRKSPNEDTGPIDPDDDDNVIALPGHDRERRDVPDFSAYLDPNADHADVAKGLSGIQMQDRSFSPQTFLEGSKLAYEMIVQAFADADRSTLRPLLTDEVYKGFTEVIDSREKEGHSANTSIIGVHDAKILYAELHGKAAEITVHFNSEMITYGEDRDGEIVEGDKTKIRKVSDIWTFRRDLSKGDPNWKLEATGE